MGPQVEDRRLARDVCHACLKKATSNINAADEAGASHGASLLIVRCDGAKGRSNRPN